MKTYWMVWVTFSNLFDAEVLLLPQAPARLRSLGRTDTRSPLAQQSDDCSGSQSLSTLKSNVDGATATC